jgi:hypothetical protein
MAAKPYLEGKSWSFRLRLKGQEIYRTGFATTAEARRESERLRHKITETGKPKRGGPWRTTLGQGLWLLRAAMAKLLSERQYRSMTASVEITCRSTACFSEQVDDSSWHGTACQRSHFHGLSMSASPLADS